MKRLATIAAALVLCVSCALGTPVTGASAAPEYVTVAVAPPSLEYLTVALTGRTAAHHGAEHHARRCKTRTRKGRRHAQRTVTAHSHRRRHAHARHCRRRQSAPHAPGNTPLTTAPSPALTATGTTGSTSAGSAGSPAPGSSPGQAPSGPPPSVPRVQVTATEYSYTMSRTSVPAGRVIVEFVNRGQDEHNLTLVEREGDLAGSFPNALSGGVSDQSLILRAGSYTLFCSLPEHQSKGMKATLVVQ